ncbi:M1 family metallopeptidase [Corallibacter sp.]|uniref:M1 family metallopeptidase n=1 Tax=Corallibacter sp. TaxID=2038084 RepID=UPI003AB686C2
MKDKTLKIPYFGLIVVVKKLMKQIFYFLLFLLSTICYSQQTDYVDFLQAKPEISFDVQEKKVFGNVTYQFKVLASVDSIFLDAKKMTFTNVQVNDRKIKYENDGNKLWLIDDFKEGIDYSLTFSYEATPQKALYFVGWDNEAPNQIWTQGQGKYTSNWLPSIDDTNDKIEFDLSITFQSDYQVIANGKLVDVERLDHSDYYTWHYDMKQPMSSYLVALVIGEYDKKVEISESNIPLEMYYYPKDSNVVEPTYRYSTQMFDFLESEIGVSYPWQNYKQIPVHDFLYAGMENTGTTIFADTYVVDSIAFIDKNYVNVNAHELAHQWFGDLVTAKSGEHHWLQEGFATYYALLAERDVFGDNYYYWRLYEYYHDLINQERLNQGTSLLNPKSSSLTFYKRGCWVLNALRENVGDEPFKEALQAYLEKHKFKNVETSDFISEVEKASGLKLDSFVDTWIVSDVFPQEKAHELLLQSTFIQEYEMVDCELANARCDYYLEATISDEAKSKIISQIPNRIPEKLFNSSLKVRQAIATNVTQIPVGLKPMYETLLDDASYATVEAALYHLWLNFPQDRSLYLNKTSDLIGFKDKNIRLLWLVLALSTTDYKAELNNEFYRELVGYTSEKYNFEVRLNAFQYIDAMALYNDVCIDNLKQATKHHNWRLVKFAKDKLEQLKNKKQ